VTLQMVDRPSSEIASQLSEGNIDVAVGPPHPMPEWIGQVQLHGSYIVSVTRKDHPVLAERGVKPGSRIPPEVFCQVPQVFMSMDGSVKGTMDVALGEQGLARKVAMTVPHFQAVALCVAGSDLLGNLPIHFARLAGRLHGLDLYLPPFDPPILGGSAFWHKRFDRDPANLWLRDCIAKALDLGSVDAERLRAASTLEAVQGNDHRASNPR
jgi:DNA-binding transcriptional LysR family regulator